MARRPGGGKLYLSVCGKLAAMQIDPVEKKLFNHFYPGTRIFTSEPSRATGTAYFVRTTLS